MRSCWFTGMLAPTLVLAAVAGCGSGPDPDDIAWTDQVCGALSVFSTAATTQPALDGSNPAAAVTGLGDYLGSTVTALDTTISRLDAAGASPLEGGDQYVAKLTETLTRIRTSFSTAKDQLAGVDTSSVESVTTALPAAVAPLQELTELADPTEGLQANEQLRTAADQAPSCRQLRAAG